MPPRTRATSSPTPAKRAARRKKADDVAETPAPTPATTRKRKAASKVVAAPETIAENPAPASPSRIVTPRSPSPAKAPSSTAAEVDNPASKSPAKSAPAQDAAAHTGENTHFEFGGPIGACGIMISLPLVVLGLYYSCNKEVCLDFATLSSAEALAAFWTKMVAQLPSRWTDLLSTEAVSMTLGWVALQVAFERVLPGEVALGTPLPVPTGSAPPAGAVTTANAMTGKVEHRLPYTMSGHLQFWLTLVVLHFGRPIISNLHEQQQQASAADSVLQFKGFDPLLDLTAVYDHYAGLIAVAALVSYALSAYLYAASFLPNQILARGGQSGYAVYDFFIGRELNPRVFGGSLDLKQFCELRPGLIGWAVINLSMAYAQYRSSAGISGSMLSVVLFQGIYVWDALYNERAILTTMDITTDGFGFMLTFGDLCWVPFIYSLQARYLVDHDPQLSMVSLTIITAIHFLGYYIFRSANSEKDAFRANPHAPEVAHLQYICTKRGTKLLTSGWWGAARKINYTGDWLITLSWCMLCGFSSPIPYFQAIYFAILLVHRAMRDDHACAAKYGADWDEYKRRVPYMFIPGVV